MEEFPPNSFKSREREAKKVERVTSGDAVRRKTSLGKQFQRTFFSGDARTALEYVIFNVLLPSAQDTIIDAGQSWIERVVKGNSRPLRRGYGPTSGPQGYVSYNRMSQQQRDDRPPMPRYQQLSRQARARHDFGEIIIPSRSEAEEVLERLYDLIEKYDFATVADLYELTGLESSHVDHRWGWDDLRGASVNLVRGRGYLLNLPEPESIQ